MVKTTALYLLPNKNYSSYSAVSSMLKRIIVGYTTSIENNAFYNTDEKVIVLSARQSQRIVKKMNTKYVNNKGCPCIIGTLSSSLSPLTREPPQVIPSIWVDILPIGRTHSVDKSPKRVCSHSLLLLRYCIFKVLG